jgi:hypothetical protein
MDPNVEIPYCPVPPESVSDVVPMLIVLGLFLAAGWLYRRWKK